MTVEPADPLGDPQSPPPPGPSDVGNIVTFGDRYPDVTTYFDHDQPA